MKPIFIVAEIGINHNGDMSICKKLIDTAKEAGCDAVKFQKRDLDQVYTQEFLDSPRESQWGTTQRDQKKGLEFGINQYKEIDAYCKEKKVEWYASAWDLNSQEFLRQFNCNYNKVASAMIIYEDLLKKIAEEGKHTFISTGMSEYNNIQKAVDIFRSAKCPFELMHTVSTYPMKDEDANLKLINTLRDKFDCDVGYSGHEVGLAISYAAATLNITSLERHITLSRAMYGSDQAASLEPAGLKQLVGGVRKIEKALGDGQKKIIDAEKPIAKKLREHLYVN
ncbi:N-acetylneuraminate synthase family protein [Candidatus Pelagibacter bacterium]|nr:N-acetylneuraminate synthase family protein [Candidatus Pelagibacter bacterium]MDA8844881.1 N-acetylneuraminate synthase family protein [Candidatus Pelagibacter bacterium]